MDTQATGNNDFGYFSGGTPGTTEERKVIDRIDYSNDTVTASPKGPLSAVKYFHAATGNNDFDTLVVVLLLQDQK